MQRLHFLRWLALAIAVCSLQCLESLSDDCTKTLTCGNEPLAKLDTECRWRFPDGGIWENGPTLSPEKRWIWPRTGREVADQSFKCPVGDAGVALPQGDGGIGGVEGNCNTLGCDAPLQCEPVSGHCVTCLDDSQCVGVTDPNLGPVPMCDQRVHACVACLRDGDCPSSTRHCKKDGNDPTRNECVQCLDTAHCENNQTCDTATDECTARCTARGQCAEPKPICDIPDGPPSALGGLCVQCTDDTTCGPGAPQCNPTTKQCVPCVGVGASTGACAPNQVCNALNQCVECVSEAQCGEEKPLCDTARNKCIACFNSAQCTDPNASRCNTADSVCAACTSDVQCETNLPFCEGGRCVACRDDDQCGGRRCDLSTGNCENCLTDAHCGESTLARCNTTDHLCTGCNADSQCFGRFGVRQLCRPDNGSCVQCKTNTECALDGQKARCDTGSGLCAGCKVDNDCNQIEGQPACAGGNGNNGRCVQCTDNTDCVGNMAGPACKVTAGGSSAPVNTCVQCVVDADCPTAGAARCVANQCQPCADNTNCAHLSGTGICDTSVPSPVCVACTGPQDDACGPNVCNSLTKVCTNLPANTAGICETCVSDAHCTGGQATGASGRRCALQVFETTEVGYFCFPLAQTGACPLTPFAGPANLDTVDGVPANVCLLRRTTCPALADFGLQGTDCTTDAACGVAQLEDGVCDTGAGKCSVPCTADVDCQGGSLSCLGSVCQL